MRSGFARAVTFVVGALLVMLAFCVPAVAAGQDQAIRPQRPILLFNGKDLSGLYSWLKDAKYEDPRKVFTVQDGVLRISGDGLGYICTKESYRDYHLVLEYRWGTKTWGKRADRARDSGVIVHCQDPDGSFGNTFMAGLEAQIIEGGTGDVLVLPGKRADGSVIPASLTAEVTRDRDGETVWKQGGERRVLPRGRINWFGRDPDWADKIGFRGPRDIDSPGQEWTRLDIICDGGHIAYRVNGILACEGFDSVPSSGKILLQTELAEIFVRRFELLPLGASGESTCSNTAAGACAQTSSGPSCSQVRSVVDPKWPQKPNDFIWGAMSGIAVDEQDQVYLFNRSEPTVQIYQRDGAFLRSWSTANPKGTHHIKFDPEGNVWLADFRNHTIEKRTPQGKLLLTLGEAGKPGCDENHFKGPTDMAFLPCGDVFISDGYGNRRVAHFDKRGRFIKQWGEEGTEPGQFALPHAIAIDAQQRVYVADRNNARIQVFNTAGKLLAVWDDLLMPWGLTVTNGNEIWVCGASRVRQPDDSGWVITPPPDQLLMKLSPEGKVLLRLKLGFSAGNPGRPGEVDWVHCIAVDSKGDFYLGDIQGKRAQKFSLKSDH